MNRDMGLFLGNMIGLVEDIDLGLSGKCLARFIGVRICIDILKPLPKSLNVIVDSDQKPITIIAAFERLPIFCYYSGLIGHSLRECSDLPPNKPLPPKSSLQYGEWLKVNYSPLPKKPNSRSQGFDKNSNPPPDTYDNPSNPSEPLTKRSPELPSKGSGN